MGRGGAGGVPAPDCGDLTQRGRTKFDRPEASVGPGLQPRGRQTLASSTERGLSRASLSASVLRNGIRITLLMMVLFLDFDGVLHPDAVYLVGGRPTLRAEGAPSSCGRPCWSTC